MALVVPLPRQSVGGGKFSRFSLLKTIAWRGILSFGDPFLDSCVVNHLGDEVDPHQLVEDKCLSLSGTIFINIPIFIFMIQ